MRFVWEFSPLLELCHLRTSGPVSTGIPASYSADHFPHTSAISARYSLALSYLAFIFCKSISRNQLTPREGSFTSESYVFFHRSEDKYKPLHAIDFLT